MLQHVHVNEANNVAIFNPSGLVKIKKLSANIEEIRTQANEVAKRIEMTYRKAQASQAGL